MNGMSIFKYFKPVQKCLRNGTFECHWKSIEIWLVTKILDFWNRYNAPIFVLKSTKRVDQSQLGGGTVDKFSNLTNKKKINLCRKFYLKMGYMKIILPKPLPCCGFVKELKTLKIESKTYHSHLEYFIRERSHIFMEGWP